MSATLLEKRLWHRYFPVNFAKFLRTSFPQNTSGRLLLKWNSIFFDCSFEHHQLNSSSRTLSETIGTWVLLMWEKGPFEEQELQIKPQNCKFAYLCGLLLHNYNSNKVGRRIFFLEWKKKFFDSFRFVFDSFWFVYLRLHLSSD